MRSIESLEELSANISLISVESSDIIWKQNIADELKNFEKTKLVGFLSMSSDLNKIQRILHDICKELQSSHNSFDATRHQYVKTTKEKYEQLFKDDKSTILLHGAGHVSYCVCRRIMHDFNDHNPYNMEVYTFLNNLKDLLYFAGRLVNIFRIYGETKYSY